MWTTLPWYRLALGQNRVSKCDGVRFFNRTLGRLSTCKLCLTSRGTSLYLFDYLYAFVLFYDPSFVHNGQLDLVHFFSTLWGTFVTQQIRTIFLPARASERSAITCAWFNTRIRRFRSTGRFARRWDRVCVWIERNRSRRPSYDFYG